MEVRSNCQMILVLVKLHHPTKPPFLNQCPSLYLIPMYFMIYYNPFPHNSQRMRRVIREEKIGGLNHPQPPTNMQAIGGTIVQD